MKLNPVSINKCFYVEIYGNMSPDENPDFKLVLSQVFFGGEQFEVFLDNLPMMFGGDIDVNHITNNLSNLLETGYYEKQTEINSITIKCNKGIN